MKKYKKNSHFASRAVQEYNDDDDDDDDDEDEYEDF